MHGFHGRLLHIDLATHASQWLALDPAVLRAYLGSNSRLRLKVHKVRVGAREFLRFAYVVGMRPLKSVTLEAIVELLTTRFRAMAEARAAEQLRYSLPDTLLLLPTPVAQSTIHRKRLAATNRFISPPLLSRWSVATTCSLVLPTKYG